VRFETGATRASLALQARLERRHALRAGLVITVSRYCPKRLEELYEVRNAIVVSQALEDAPIADGKQSRCFCDVRDTVEAITRLLGAVLSVK
jgi:hypothetical protein